jgi:hypothetical protein
MNSTSMKEHAWRPNLDSLVAQLTEAAYPVALRHGDRGSWVDLELDLWRALGQAMRQWEQENPRRSNSGVF